jgi:hypothetical protein
MRRTVLNMGATMAAVLLVAASVAGSVVAAPRSPLATAATGPATSGQATRPHALTRPTLTYRQAATRGSVNVRKLAAGRPTVHPKAALPRLTRSTTSSGLPSTRGPKVGALAVPAPTPVTFSGPDPIAGTPFTGLAQVGGTVTDVDPPDPWVAVGPEHIVQAVNLDFRMTDRQGGHATETSMFDFFQLNLGAYDSDPHVIYDSLHGRWLATEVSWDCIPGGPDGSSTFGTGYIDFAISRTADPTGVWDLGQIWFDDLLPDYPAPGTSTDKIGIGVNLFAMTHAASSIGGADCVDGSSPYAGTDSVYMDWNDLTNGGGFTLSELYLPPSDLDLPGSFSPRIALQAPATSATLQEVIGYDAGAGAMGLYYVTVKGSVVAQLANVDASWDLTGGLGGVAMLANDQDPPQPASGLGGSDTIDSAVDARVTDAVWQGNRMAFVSTYPCGTGPRDCVRVTELNTAGADVTHEPSVTQDFVVAESGKDLFMGGAGLSGDGTLHLAWTRSSDSDDPSSYAAHQALGATANTISDPEILASGTAGYAGERWGDYVGVAQDPQVPNQAWNANEYSGGTAWLTKVTPLQTAASTYVPIAPVRVLNTRSGVGLSGMFTMGKARSWSVAGVGGIPASAMAVTANVTVANQTAPGFVAITVNPTNTPRTSTINFPIGSSRANNVTIPLSSTGKLSAVYIAKAGAKTNVLFDVTGYFLADDSGDTFTPATPSRIINTRSNVGLPGKFASGTPRSFVAAGVGGVPLTATAITGNLTVVSPTKGGNVAITKDPVASPPTSTLNFPTGVHSQANGFFAPLNGSGAFSLVYNAGSASARADIIVDVTGYFETGTGGFRFVPLEPGRVMNTRSTAVLSGLTGKFHAGTPRTLDVDGHWGVPIGAKAVVANLTVAGQTGSGNVAVTPDPTATPTTSTINFPVGSSMANGLVGPLNSSGDLSMTYSSGAGKTTDLILDVSGYFQ